MPGTWGDPGVLWGDPAVTWSGGVYVPPPPPPPPPPTPERPGPSRHDWKWILSGGAAGVGVELGKLGKQRKLSVRLKASADAGFQIDGRTEAAAGITELVTDLHVVRDGVRLYRGRVGATSDDVGIDRHTTQVGTSAYRALVEQRLLWAALGPYVATEESDVVWAVIQHLQAQLGGDYGITRGVGAVTGQPVNASFAVGVAAGQAIGQVADADVGFDWDVTPDPDPNVDAFTFDVWHPTRGTDRQEVLDYAGLVQSARRQVDPRGYANALRETGASGLTAELRYAADLATAAEGRWDAQVGRTDVSSQAVLAALADGELDRLSTVTPSWTVRLKPGSWRGPDHIWLGDPCKLVVQSGRLDVAVVERVYQIDIALNDDNDETVDLTLGAPKPDGIRELAAQAARLTTLERR